MTTCNYDESDCYKVRSLPSIEGISANVGYSSGGQLLVLFGHGFNSEDISIDIDGTPCDVKSITDEVVTCQTQASGAASTVPGTYRG
mmetsp:Transcript_43954/g.42538  ORF Transcript_43954/g.42538 Transcript_43954/m.42538 type:complete len:87 (+) Transcript_43954:783-1043(+)